LSFVNFFLYLYWDKFFKGVLNDILEWLDLLGDLKSALLFYGIVVKYNFFERTDLIFNYITDIYIINQLYNTFTIIKIVFDDIRFYKK